MAWIKNALDLSIQSMSYPTVPTSLLKLDIILPPRTYQEQLNMPDPTPGCMPPSWDYEFDGAQGLVDLSWTQRVPLIQQDDIDKNLLYNQYPY